MTDTIFPIFNSMEIQSRCNPLNGSLSLKPVVKNKMLENLSADVTDCRNKSFNDENCKKVCTTIYTFGEENYFLHGQSDYFITVLSNYVSNFDLNEDVKFTTEEVAVVKMTNEDAKGNHPDVKGLMWYKMNEFEADLSKEGAHFASLASDSNL